MTNHFLRLIICICLGAVRLQAQESENQREGVFASDLGDSLGAGLFRAKQIWQLKLREINAPDASAQLAEGALSPQGVATIGRLFEQSIQSALTVEGSAPVAPELGGFAAFDGSLILHEQPHALRQVQCELAARANNLDGLTELYELYPRHMGELDPANALKRIIHSPAISVEKKSALVKKIVSGLLYSSGHTFLFENEALQTSLLREEWRGRFLGAWHIHPPEYGPDGWLPGEMNPGGNDLEAARESPEFVLIFQPDGFDLVDLFALKGSAHTDLSKIKRHSFRSENWRRRFEALHRTFHSATAASARRSNCRND